MESTPSDTNEAVVNEITERLGLLVENRQAELNLCRKTIMGQSHVYGVEEAKTGEEALSKLRSKRYDAVVVDYELPDIAGSDLVKQVHDACPNCPIIVITSIDSP